jgi:hypothetical protein
VTRCTDPTALQTEAEIDKRIWQSTRLTNSWDAGFARSIVVRTVAESLIDAVVVIEQSGVETLRLRPCFFDGTLISQMQPPDRPHAERLLSAGVHDLGRAWYHRGARSFVRAERAELTVGGGVRLGLHPSGAWTGPAALVKVAEEYASKPDNMAKLAKAAAYADYGQRRAETSDQRPRNARATAVFGAKAAIGARSTPMRSATLEFGIAVGSIFGHESNSD